MWTALCSPRASSRLPYDPRPVSHTTTSKGRRRRAPNKPVPAFVLARVPPFDARRGYRRPQPTGVGVAGHDQEAIADFWRGRDGGLFVRFTSQGYVFHYEARLQSGAPIEQADMEAFALYVSDVLMEWLCEGVDDDPSSVV
jgi:hypothetical protein